MLFIYSTRVLVPRGEPPDPPGGVGAARWPPDRGLEGLPPALRGGPPRGERLHRRHVPGVRAAAGHLLGRHEDRGRRPAQPRLGLRGHRHAGQSHRLRLQRYISNLHTSGWQLRLVDFDFCYSNVYQVVLGLFGIWK